MPCYSHVAAPWWCPAAGNLGRMVEQLLPQLFFSLHPSEDGALTPRQAAKVDRVLARLYSEISAETGSGLPPPEPLPRRGLRFPGFRTHLHRALARLGADPQAKEELLRLLLADFQRPETTDVPDDGRSSPEIAAGAGQDFTRQPPTIEDEDCSAGQVACWLPPALSSEQMQAYIKVLREG